MTSNYRTLLSTVVVSPEKLAELNEAFDVVYYHPDKNVPLDELQQVDVWLCGWAGPLPGLTLRDLPRLKLLQLTSAGANYALQNDLFHEASAKNQLTLCTSSGIHAYSIPQFVVAQIVNLYMFNYQQVGLVKQTRRWIKKAELGLQLLPEGNLPSTSIYGKTAGILGYGHIGRETARVLKAMNVKIIAANSRGERSVDTGYIIPATGDPDGVIPSAFYSTSDPESFKEFLSRTDILVASLPSTPATRGMLKRQHFGYLPDGSILVNVGRGDLFDSDDLLAALDSPGGLVAAALDVTDPEPLPEGHPLLSHERVFVTLHTSGDFIGHGDAVADLLLTSVARARSGGPVINAVDIDKGY